jgi:hypothetical protein
MYATYEDETAAQGPAADAEDESTCTACGARLTPDSHFCGWCGSSSAPERATDDDGPIPAGHFLG